MKQKNLLFATLFGLLTFVVTGCFPDNSSVYDGTLQVEFRPTEYSLNLSNETVYSANIQLIGPHQDSPINLNFEIDNDRSTAIRGQHYEIEGDAAVIPANSSFAEIQISTITDAFDQGDSVLLVINLLGDDSGEIIPAHNYRTLEVSISQ